MPISDSEPGPERPSDDPFDVVLDEDFVRAAPVKEGPVPGLLRPGALPPPPKRVWPRNAALAAAAAVLTVLAFRFVGPDDDGEHAAAPTATAPAATATAAIATASAAQSTAARPSGRPPAPLAELFPAEVKTASGAVYTRVASKDLGNCPEPTSVGPDLAAMIAASKGCLGHQIALYKDARNNQFNLAVFTMKDPADTLKLVTELAIAYDSYQVGAQAPPPDSGLPTLAADSGLVQAFTGAGRMVVAGLGQWSDGRVADYGGLTKLVEPLLKDVTDRAMAYETRG
ncbi:hypothetical protein [Kitasatospora sp. DSM 101779]|uniref:hypothetical protein n=1 Tax=Kitasatospora sp. DSM 101779 TaxID=2853165 RepID=UPI0021D8B67A|nr:hypothetical protein [Kitasatospora sp. DSM 101779]MCU7821443.1 hypothetical protein [Kitasatospora sp. DSM 101779]